MTDPAPGPATSSPALPLPSPARRRRGPVDLREGVAFLLDGEPRTVVREAVRSVDGATVLALRRPDDAVELVPLPDLLFRRDVRLPDADATAPVVSAYPARGGPGQPAEATDLTPQALRRTQLRLAHTLEAETGFRSGDPFVALPGEPRPQYDPDLVPSLVARRHSKVAELAAAAAALDPDTARAAGVEQVSYRTLERIAATWWRTRSVTAVVDRRHLRPRTGRQVTDELREAVYEVEEDFSAQRSRVSVATKYRRLRFVLAANGVPRDDWPVYETYRVITREWFGPDGARQKYRRTQEALPPQGRPVVSTRPGQVVMLDTNNWDVLVRDGLFGNPVEARLTLALDVYTRSIVGFRFTLTSDKSVDVAMVLRDVMMPLPMRPEWGETAEWPYPGVPANVVADAAGYEVAGKPFMQPETITTDHGSVYANHHLVEVTERCGTNFLPARRMRARDKAACEVVFRVIRQLLLEQLPGYRGVDVADRGADPEGDASMTLREAERLVASFVVNIWQRRALGEHRPYWDADGSHSPNSLFATSMAQAGWAMQIPDRTLYYELLESAPVQVLERGVKVKGLWYRGNVLERFLLPSARGGRRGGKYIVKRDPRDARAVFFQHPESLEWHELRWTGLPAAGEFPSFNDVTAKAVLAVARARRIKPQSDEELLPIFHELLALVDEETGLAGGKAGRARRTARAREDHQGSQAAADAAHARGDQPIADESPEGAPPAPLRAVPDPAAEPQPATAPEAPQRADRQADAVRQTAAAVDARRRKQREAAVPAAPAVPLTLREARRRAEEEDDDA